MPKHPDPAGESFQNDPHSILLERAQSCYDVSSFLRIDGSMSVEDILAKFAERQNKLAVPEEKI